ncbi:23S rRNA (guanosine(2251)-2'-O)-methyltransferase RlmB [Komagataeibacter melomenusus]
MNMRTSRRRGASSGAHSASPARAMPERGGRRGGRGAASAPAGTCWLYGLHAVQAALENPARKLRQLLVTAEAQETLAARLEGGFPIQAVRAERTHLDALCGADAVHQGMALLADMLTPPDLDTVLEQPGPVLVLDQVTDPRNVGAILRSAAAFGAVAVVMQDRNAPDETGTLARAASGALEIVPLIRVVNLSRVLDALKARGLWVVGLDAGGGILDGAAFHQRRVALVLGAEGAGLRRLTREHCDEIAGLAMSSQMESLNVSNAAAVALYEMFRHR